METPHLGPSNEPSPDLDQDNSNIFAEAFAKTDTQRSRSSSSSSTLHGYDQTPWEGISPTAGGWAPPRATRARGKTETSTTVEVERWTREELEASMDESQQRSRQDTKMDSDPEADGPAKQNKALRLDTAMDTLRRSLHASSAINNEGEATGESEPLRPFSTQRNLSLSNFYTGHGHERVSDRQSREHSALSPHSVRTPCSAVISDTSDETQPLLGRPRSSTGASSKRVPKFVKPPKRKSSDYGTTSSPLLSPVAQDTILPPRARSGTRNSRPSTPRSPLSTRHFMPPLVEDSEAGKPKICRRCGLRRISWHVEQERRSETAALERGKRLKIAVAAANVAWVGLMIGAIILATKLSFEAAGWIVLIPVALCMIFNYATAGIWRRRPVCFCKDGLKNKATASWYRRIPGIGSLLTGNPEKRRKRNYPSLSG